MEWHAMRQSVANVIYFACSDTFIRSFFALSTFIFFILPLRYALDIIASVAFGLDVNTLANPDNYFRKMESRINNGEIVNVLRQTFIFLYPK